MPTYNVEKYFRECLDSVVNQTLVEIEIIPVDDGSPDNCGKIMDEYAQKDSRIKPIHKQNGGYGSAVNAGIEAAQGEYIGIVETDDVCEPDMFEKLYNQAKKFDADVCKCSFYKYYSDLENNNNEKYIYGNKRIEKFPNDRSFKISECPELLNFHASIWTNIYKKEFLLKNNIKVNSTRSASYQDFPFMVECMCKADRIAVVHDYLYHWRIETGQNSSTVRTDDRLMIMAYQCEQVKSVLKENNLYSADVKEAIVKHMFTTNNNFFTVIDWKYKKEYFDKINTLFNDLKNDSNFEYKYFSKKEKRKMMNFVNGNYYLTILPLLRREVFQLRFNNQEKYIKLLGVKIKL